ncbi:mitochondrial methionyl-tRNA synthetase [Spathaspora passalidarum NRRL Y-27907]|uniref:Methionine--tRNA ligase, mitochondrial n=1 Tax=Spathaspora passalidarum (strain NRRL Y-27907 / 11-Y1) TaxID=619300 RepID=G3ASH3_SPAPN|nr:mitochondrial methionyl-tRNA synthetase [Spathaspora passalidarum NRRL Y-27907]EGW31091.1 mitochondrial methionyl-tRNA synthetase [Spathaspora passalidarum NRRL Y-27907]
MATRYNNMIIRSRPWYIFKRLNSTKPFFTSTPIFYVNAAPHIGHLYSMLLADVRTRWEKLDPNKKAYFLTGTDEHGLKIQAAAEKQGIDPKLFVDQVSTNFKDLANLVNIDYDRFIRTTDADHITLVRHFWEMMMEKGYIYQGSHKGWYCVSDETFYPDNQIEEFVNKEGETKKRSIETKNEVVYQEENNYFFKLSEFQSQLLTFLKSNPDFIKPKSKYELIVNELTKNKLPDLSISRPASRLKWSIEVPNDPTQKMYVWFDALLNYLTAAGFPQGFTLGEQGQYITSPTNIWPATHVIGKDIVRFHCIYWPIFLMAAKIDLPRQVIVHSHWLVDGVKMSKSLGNVIDPVDISKYYGIDPVRFFLIENSNIADDCKFSEVALSSTRDMLLGKYGNLFMRIGAKNFNVRESVQDYHSGKFTNIEDTIKAHTINRDSVDILIQQRQELIEKLDSLYERMNENFVNFDSMKAMQSWWSVLDATNGIFQTAEPWLYAKKIKQDDPSKQEYANLISSYVFMCAETCRITSILLQPIAPELAERMLDRLGVAKDNRNSTFAKFGADSSYGAGANDKGHKVPLEKVELRIEAES